MHFNINFIVFTVYLICLFTVTRVYSKFALSFLYSLINSLIHYKPRGPCLSARLIFYPRSREERNKSLSFSLPPPLSFSYNAWERARRGPLAGDNRARASHPSLFSCTRTRVDDYVSEVALPNVIADGNSDLLGMDVKRVLFSFSLFVSFFFFNPTSDVYLHAFKSHRRVRGTRGPKYRSDSLIQAASNPFAYTHVISIYIRFWTNKLTADAFSLSLSLLLKKYFVFSSLGQQDASRLSRSAARVRECVTWCVWTWWMDGWRKRKRGK